MEGAALLALGLLHGDVRVPQQRIGIITRAGMGQTQAAAEQQAFAIHPVGFGQHFGDALGQFFRARTVATGIQQQGEFVAAQARQHIAALQLATQTRHHLQDQAIAALMTEGIVDVLEVVQIEMAEGQAVAGEFGQARGQQGLEALAVGDAGQCILLGQALHGALQGSVVGGMTQGTAQHGRAQLGAAEPVADTFGALFGFVFQQQDQREGAAARRRQTARRGQHQRAGLFIEQAAGGGPGGRGDQGCSAVQLLQTLTQQFGPDGRICQQQQAHGFDKRAQMTSPATSTRHRAATAKALQALYVHLSLWVLPDTSPTLQPATPSDNDRSWAKGTDLL